MTADRLRILTVSPSATAGGAEKVALELARAYREAGHDSWLAVGRLDPGGGSEEGLLKIPAGRPVSPPSRLCRSLAEHLRPREKRVRGLWRLRYLLETLGDGRAGLQRALGIEVFEFPGSRRLLDLPPVAPDVVHLHNLHGGYFDLRFLAELSRRVPVVLTLHDAWLLSGHCAYPLGCERWRTGCGRCPDLRIYPSVERDATALNWRRKKRIYRRSRLHVASPSQWLLDRAAESMLRFGIAERRKIPYGVDLEAFRPGDRAAAREHLGLPQEDPILLFVANAARRSSYKDCGTVEAAARRLARNREERILLLVLGDRSEPIRVDGAEIRFLPFRPDPGQVAAHYRAADVVLHAAHPESENFPNAVLEALACGRPVVATAVGGIPEQLDDGIEGFLVPAGEPEAMAARVAALLADQALSRKIAAAARARAESAFAPERQVADYLAWYQEILETGAVAA